MLHVQDANDEGVDPFARDMYAFGNLVSPGPLPVQSAWRLLAWLLLVWFLRCVDPPTGYSPASWTPASPDPRLPAPGWLGRCTPAMCCR